MEGKEEGTSSYFSDGDFWTTGNKDQSGETSQPYTEEERAAMPEFSPRPVIRGDAIGIDPSEIESFRPLPDDNHAQNTWMPPDDGKADTSDSNDIASRDGWQLQQSSLQFNALNSASYAEQTGLNGRQGTSSVISRMAGHGRSFSGADMESFNQYGSSLIESLYPSSNIHHAQNTLMSPDDGRADTSNNEDVVSTDAAPQGDPSSDDGPDPSQIESLHPSSNNHHVQNKLMPPDDGRTDTSNNDDVVSTDAAPQGDPSSDDGPGTSNPRYRIDPAAAASLRGSDMRSRYRPAEVTSDAKNCLFVKGPRDQAQIENEFLNCHGYQRVRRTALDVT